MNKYGNIEKVIDGIIFQSIKEANRYQELKLLLKAKEIWELEVQPVFQLQKGFKDKQGKKHRPITYTPDFGYYDKRGSIIEDVKGIKTDVYKLKKKLFLYRFQKYTFIEL